MHREKNMLLIGCCIALIIISFALGMEFKQFEGDMSNVSFVFTQDFGEEASGLTYIEFPLKECVDDAKTKIAGNLVEGSEGAADIVLTTDMSWTMVMCMAGGGGSFCSDRYGPQCKKNGPFDISAPSECDCSADDILGFCRTDPNFVNGFYDVYPMLFVNNSYDSCIADSDLDGACPADMWLNETEPKIAISEQWLRECPDDLVESDSKESCLWNKSCIDTVKDSEYRDCHNTDSCSPDEVFNGNSYVSCEPNDDCASIGKTDHGEREVCTWNIGGCNEGWESRNWQWTQCRWRKVCNSDEIQRPQTHYFEISWESSSDCPDDKVWTGNTRLGSCEFRDECLAGQVDNGNQYINCVYKSACSPDETETGSRYIDHSWEPSSDCADGKVWTGNTQQGECSYLDECQSGQVDNGPHYINCVSRTACNSGEVETGSTYVDKNWQPSNDCNGQVWTGNTQDGSYHYQDACTSDQSDHGIEYVYCQWQPECTDPKNISIDSRLINCNVQDSCSSGQVDNGEVLTDPTWKASCDPDEKELDSRATSECYDMDSCPADYFDTGESLTNMHFETDDMSSSTVYCTKVNWYDEFYTCWDRQRSCCVPEYHCAKRKRECCVHEEYCCEQKHNCSDTEYECATEQKQCCQEKRECCNTEYDCAVRQPLCCQEAYQCCNTEYECGVLEHRCCKQRHYCCRDTRDCCDELDNCCTEYYDCCHIDKLCIGFADNCCENIEQYDCVNDSTGSFQLFYDDALEFGCPSVSSIGDGGYANGSMPDPSESCMAEGNNTYYCELAMGGAGTCTEYTCDIVREKLARYLDKDFIGKVINSTDSNKRVALVSYSDTAALDEPLTTDKVLLNSTINADYWAVKDGQTCISCGLVKAIDELKDNAKTFAVRSIVLMTDGDANTLLDGSYGFTPAWKDLAAQEAIDVACNTDNSESAVSNNIIIYTVAFGSSVNDRKTLKTIANCTNGAFYQGSDETELAKIYENISESIKSSLPVPKIDVLNNKIFDFNMSSTLSGEVVWNDASCGTNADCTSLIDELNSGLTYCNQNNINPCDLYWNISSETAGNITLKELDINTVHINTGPVIVPDGEISEHKFDCNEIINPSNVCGDGQLLIGVEDCDDSNNINGDGCDSNCKREPSYSCTWMNRHTYENNDFDPISLPRLVSDPDTPDIDLVWTVQGGDRLAVNIDEFQTAQISVPDDWNGTEQINFTVSDGTSQDKICFNFTVGGVPDYNMSSPGETRLLVSKGKLITGYSENSLTGNVSNWGPYIISIKVWEKKR